MQSQIQHTELQYIKPKILIVGESGSGKNTIQDYLTSLYGHKPLLSYTTRPKRFPEENTHTFIDEGEYYRCRAENNIIAYTYYNGNHYFATEHQLKESDVYIIDIEGIKYLKEHSTIPFIVFYIKVPKLKRIERMKQRGDSEQQIKKRIEFDEKAFGKGKDLCNYVFENNNSLYTAAKINKIIKNLEMLIWKSNK